MARAFGTVTTNTQGYDFAEYYSIGKNRPSLLLKILFIINIFAIIIIVRDLEFCQSGTSKRK
jgi:hypothetical protein